MGGKPKPKTEEKIAKPKLSPVELELHALPLRGSVEAVKEALREQGAEVIRRSGLAVPEPGASLPPEASDIVAKLRAGHPVKLVAAASLHERLMSLLEPMLEEAGLPAERLSEAIALGNEFSELHERMPGSRSI